MRLRQSAGDQTIGCAEEIHLDRVVNHQVNGHERVDLLWIIAQARHRGTHGSQVNHCRDAGKILHHDAGRQEGDARTGSTSRGGWTPSSDVLYISLCDLLVIALA